MKGNRGGTKHFRSQSRPAYINLKVIYWGGRERDKILPVRFHPRRIAKIGFRFGADYTSQ